MELGCESYKLSTYFTRVRQDLYGARHRARSAIPSRFVTYNVPPAKCMNMPAVFDCVSYVSILLVKADEKSTLPFLVLEHLPGCRFCSEGQPAGCPV